MSRRAWIAVTTGAFFAGALLAALAMPHVAGDQALPLGWLLGLVLAGAGQSLLWQRSGRRGRRWFLLSLPGLLAAPPVLWLAGGASGYNLFTPLLLAALVSGLLLGLGQRVWWRQVAPRGWLWTLFSTVAGVASVPLGWLLGIGLAYPLGILLAEFTGNAALGAWSARWAPSWESAAFMAG